MASEQLPDPQQVALDGRRSAAAVRRRQRTRDIIEATRTLIDQRGSADAQIEDIARAVGINRAIVYRHFTGKEELFALTLVGYLDELRSLLAAAAAPHEAPEDQLSAVVRAFVDFGLAHPAFVDTAQTLMRRTGPELLNEISEAAIFKLGRAIVGCLSEVTAAVEAGRASGVFWVEDATVLANSLYAYGLGALQLARVGILVSEAAPGVPRMGQITPEQVREDLVTAALAMATRRAPR